MLHNSLEEFDNHAYPTSNNFFLLGWTWCSWQLADSLSSESDRVVEALKLWQNI